MSEYEYDYFVIGGGSGGVRSARIASQHGAKVGIAEGSNWGGTCVNVGCVPKKLMSYAADFGMGFQDAQGYGWSVEKLQFSWDQLIANKDKEINRLNAIYEKILKKNNVDIFTEFARFIDPHTLQIGDKVITADKILIAAGGTPRLPEMPGHEHALISDEFFFHKKNPGKTVIYGGGYVAVEFAHILHGIGCDVEIIYHGGMFLRGFDDDLRLGLAEEMKKIGVKLHFNSETQNIEKIQEKYIVKASHDVKIECDTVIAAIGRIPNTQHLDLDKIGIETNDKGFIKVDKNFQTNIDNIYAVGDITDTPHLTPVAIVEGHYLADTLFGSHERNNPLDYTKIPTAVFSAPPIGTIGLSEDEAKEKGSRHEATYHAKKYGMCHHIETVEDGDKTWNTYQRRFRYCCYDDKTTRIIVEEAKAQFAKDWEHCTDITLKELEVISFSACDPTELDAGVNGVHLPSDATLSERMGAYQFVHKCIDTREYIDVLLEKFGGDDMLIDSSDAERIIEEMR